MRFYCMYLSFIHLLASAIRHKWSSLPKLLVSCRGSVHNGRISIKNIFSKICLDSQVDPLRGSSGGEDAADARNL